MDSNSQQIEGRHAVAEALRAGRPVDKLYVLDGCKDGPVSSIVKAAKKGHALVQFVSRERLDQLSETKKHQGVIARMAAYEYASVEEILAKAENRGNRLSCSCWTVWKTRIIWGLLCGQQTRWGPMG